MIEHIDTEVGRLVQTVRDLGLSEKTLIVYTSDNGPWLQFKNHGGSAGPLRAGKGTTFEGGQRVPCIMWAPGRIPAGTSSNAFATNMDLLPTIASVTGVALENDRKIDGVDLTSTFTSDESLRDEFVFYSAHGALEGIRMGDWKYLRKVPRRGKNAKGPAPEPEVFLFHLSEDIGEQNNLAEQEPDRVQKMHARMEELNKEITANARPVWRKKVSS